MRIVLILIIAILAIGLVGCSPAVDLYEEANDIVTSDETLKELDESQKIMLNSQLEKYEGNNIRGTEVKALIRFINMANTNEKYPTKLIINDNSDSNILLNEGEYLLDGIIDRNYYEISLEYGENGVVTIINVNVGK